MPIYAVIYLFFLFIFAFGSSFMHFEEGRGFVFVGMEIISSVFLISFILIYFNASSITIAKPLIFLMLCYSILWEIFSFKHDMITAKEEFNIKGKELFLYTSIAASFIAPAFLAGLALVF